VRLAFTDSDDGMFTGLETLGDLINGLAEGQGVDDSLDFAPRDTLAGIFAF
jgi:hypothetical protein